MAKQVGEFSVAVFALAPMFVGSMTTICSRYMYRCSCICTKVSMIAVAAAKVSTVATVIALAVLAKVPTLSPCLPPL